MPKAKNCLNGRLQTADNRQQRAAAKIAVDSQSLRWPMHSWQTVRELNKTICVYWPSSVLASCDAVLPAFMKMPSLIMQQQRRPPATYQKSTQQQQQQQQLLQGQPQHGKHETETVTKTAKQTCIWGRVCVSVCVQIGRQQN